MSGISKDKSSNISHILISQHTEKFDVIELPNQREFSNGINHFIKKRNNSEMEDSTPPEENSHLEDNENEEK